MTPYEAKEEMKRNLKKHDYNYEKIRTIASVIKKLGISLEETVLNGEKEKKVEYDFYKWRMMAYSEIILLDEQLEELYNELHLELFE